MLQIKALCPGSVLLDSAVPDIGVPISHVSFSRLQSLIQDVVSHGATLVTGGKPYHHPVHIQGHYFGYCYAVQLPFGGVRILDMAILDLVTPYGSSGSTQTSGSINSANIRKIFDI